jgi:hypothetical protein
LSNVSSVAPKCLAWTGERARWCRSWFGISGVLPRPPKWLCWTNLWQIGVGRRRQFGLCDVLPESPKRLAWTHVLPVGRGRGRRRERRGRRGRGTRRGCGGRWWWRCGCGARRECGCERWWSRGRGRGRGRRRRREYGSRRGCGARRGGQRGCKGKRWWRRECGRRRWWRCGRNRRRLRWWSCYLGGVLPRSTKWLVCISLWPLGYALQLRGWAGLFSLFPGSPAWSTSPKPLRHWPASASVRASISRNWIRHAGLRLAQ